MAMDGKCVKLVAGSVLATLFLYFSSFFIIFTPLPIFYLSVVYGRGMGRLVAVFALAFLLIVYWVLFPVGGVSGEREQFSLLLFVPGWDLARHFGILRTQVFGTIYFLYFCLFGLVLGEGGVRKWPATRWIATSVVVVLGFCAVAGIALEMMGVMDIASELRSYISFVVTELFEAAKHGSTGASQSFQLIGNVQHFVDSVVHIMPSAFFVFTLLVGVCNVLVGGRLARSWMSGRRLIWQLALWSVPSFFIWVFILSGLAFFGNHYIVKNDLLGYAAINVLVVAVGIYFLQGWAILAYYLRKVRGYFLKLVIYVSILVFLKAALLLMVVVGIVDFWVNFRRLDKDLVKV